MEKRAPTPCGLCGRRQTAGLIDVTLGSGELCQEAAQHGEEAAVHLEGKEATEGEATGHIGGEGGHVDQDDIGSNEVVGGKVEKTKGK